MPYTLLGIDDEVTTCDCCGKTRLKCTVALSQTDVDGNEVGIVRFGRDCAARALGRRSTADKMEQAARSKSAKLLSAVSRTWPKSTVGEGWDKTPVRFDPAGRYVASSTQFHHSQVISALKQRDGSDWRYIGSTPSERLFERVG